jgi:hypothetical protein
LERFDPGHRTGQSKDDGQRDEEGFEFHTESDAKH